MAKMSCSATATRSPFLDRALVSILDCWHWANATMISMFWCRLRPVKTTEDFMASHVRVLLLFFFQTVLPFPNWQVHFMGRTQFFSALEIVIFISEVCFFYFNCPCILGDIIIFSCGYVNSTLKPPKNNTRPQGISKMGSGELGGAAVGYVFSPRVKVGTY